MSLKGQWIVRYTGTNDGTGVIDIDEIDDHYEGTAIAWDDHPNKPTSLVRIRTQSKATEHVLRDLPVSLYDKLGNALTFDQRQALSTAGITIADTADISLRLNQECLSISWTTPIGTAGYGITMSSQTRRGLPSKLIPTAVRGWDGFKKKMTELSYKRYIFRGQQDNSWRLRTSFHRTGRADLERYSLHDISDLNKIFSALTPHIFNLGNPEHYAAAISLAQHHGYPTPMLDWTWSPYVAAFFAFRNIVSNGNRRNKVRIFKFDSTEWNHLIRADKLFPFSPNISIINRPVAKVHTCDSPDA